MIQEERLLKLVRYLERNLTANFQELAKIGEVSIDTIRRDLKKLEIDGYIKCIRGGAKINNDLCNLKLGMNNAVQSTDKIKLAELISQIVVDGQAIALNSGEINVEIAKFLVENYYRLTILTNNLPVLNALAVTDKFTVIVPSGIIDTKMGAIIGNQCESDVLNYNIDTALIAVNAVSLEKGITDHNFNEAGVIKSMLKVSKQKVAIVDFNNFEKVECMKVFNLEDIDTIVTNAKPIESIISAYTNMNIKLITTEQ